MARVEDEPDNKTSKNELDNEFEILLIDTINNKHDKVADSYFTIIKSLLTLLTILTSIINTLVNDFISHSLLY
jgi:hypothetical protein